jgi:hypothetical protein
MGKTEGIYTIENKFSTAATNQENVSSNRLLNKS